MRLERIQNLDNGIAVFSQCLLGHLHVHFSAMLLQTQLRVLLKPPGRDLPLADAAQDWQWWGVVCRVGCTVLGQASQVVGKHFCSHAQRLDEDLWKIDGDLTDDRGPHHPHGLRLLVASESGLAHVSTYVAFGTRCAVIDHDALGLYIEKLLFLFGSLGW